MSRRVTLASDVSTVAAITAVGSRLARGGGSGLTALAVALVMMSVPPAGVPRAIAASSPVPHGPAVPLPRRPPMPLGEALRALGSSAGIHLTLRGPVPARAVGFMPDAHDLDVALRHLLQGVPHVIVYAETRHGPLLSAVEIIFLRVAGEAPGLPVSAALANATESVAEEGWGLDDLADRALSGPTGVDRAASLERLSHRVPATEAGEAKVSEVIRAALRDLDDGVREQAIDILKSRSDEVPLPLLAEMARDDVSPARRVQALELIAERAPEQAVESLRAALGDPEPEVGVRALELLADLHLPVAESARP